ncbi:MAG TPA: replication-associated recombination protein A, partial [Chthoniobacteraceae bacterium]|nr:replication-associated recombination protein A [Chthoniobacteraceae bacterium]
MAQGTQKEFFAATPPERTADSGAREPIAEIPPTPAPLAARMRPRSLDDYVGQQHILGPGMLLRRAIDADRIQSLILYGPPGTGKTSLAQIIAAQTRNHFERLSGVESNVAEMRRVLASSVHRLANTGKATILFIDEIHRFNKAQQDVVLPHVENGDVILLGATTENPSFEVNSALLSRSRVYVLRPLTEEDVRTIVRRALADPERGLGGKARLSQEAEDGLVAVSNGDARVALNALELANDATGGDREITLADIREALQRRSLLYDRAGDQHYDTISAFIKSVRGSDPDASLYWLMRMIDAGEDPMF